MIKEAMQWLQDRGGREAALANQALEHRTSGAPSVVLPAGMEITSVEHLLPARVRPRGTITTERLHAFQAMCGRFGEKGSPLVLVSANRSEWTLRATCILNVDAESRGDALGHADHRIELTMPPSPEFAALLKHCTHRIGHKDMLAFVEDHRDRITMFGSDEAEITFGAGLSALRKVTIEQINRSEHREDDFTTVRTGLESIEAKSSALLPYILEFSAPLFDGLSKSVIPIRVHIVSDDKRLLFRLDPIMLQAALDDVEHELMLGLSASLEDNIEVLAGSTVA